MTQVRRRTLLKAGGVLTGAMTAGAAVPSTVSAAPSGAKVLTGGMKVPWGMVFVADGTALIGERDTCAVYRVTGTGVKTLVGTVTAGGVDRLMSMALSPSFAQDRLVYAYVRTTSDARVVRMTYNGTALGTPRVVFSGIPIGSDHYGGGLTFGPDGMLYVSVGDMATAALAQDVTSLVGKTLRIRRDGTVPSNNPYGNAVWTSGHRNVECLAFDSSGRLWAPEFGETTTDELNTLVRGGDYGWPSVEGGDQDGPVHEPFATWSPTSTCSPASVAISNGYAYVASLAGQCIWRVKLAKPNAGLKEQFYYQTYGRIRTVVLAPDGSLWMVTDNHLGDDSVIRFLP